MAPLRYRHWHEGLDPYECVSVDGNAPGKLNLSHWPGNRTPEAFRHDLSTGAALLLAKAPNRAELLAGITTVTNNHWDTDGLCSAFAVIEPALGIKHGQTLLAAAMAGDFEMFTTPEGVKIDLTLTALTKSPTSQVHSGLYKTELECRGAQYEYGLNLLPKLLVNPDLHADWFARDYWTVQKDMRALREDQARLEPYESLDFAVVRAERIFHPAAVNTVVEADRILGCAQLDNGFLYEMRLTAKSWFHMVTRPYAPRPDWASLLSDLNAAAATEGGHWVADDWRDPTPAMRFVEDDNDLALAPNTHKPAEVAGLMMAFFSKHPFLPAGV